MNKLEMAHEMALAIQGTKLIHDMELVSDMAWKYVDAMQAEADKREKEESEKKRADIREMLKANNTFVEREGQHFDDVEWQPDWSQAPSLDITHWSKEGDDVCTWWIGQPTLADDCHCENNFGSGCIVFGDAPSFNYQGNWQESLRKRP